MCAAYAPPTNTDTLYNPSDYSTGSGALTLDDANLLYAKLSGSVIRGLTTFQAGLSTPSISNSGNAFTVPSSSGQLALVSDIPSLTNYVDLTTAQTISGTKSFSSRIEALDTVRIWNTPNTQNCELRYFGTLASSLITFPESSGTVALTSDLSAYVSLAGSQTISGVKTFSAAPVISTITNGAATLTLPTTTGTVAITSNTVNLTGNQTVAGVKTFSSAPVISTITNGAATLTLPSTTGTLAITSGTLNLTGDQTAAGAKTFSSSIKIGSNGSTFSQIQRGTFTMTFSSVPNQSSINQSVSFAATFSSAPNVVLTNQSGSTYSGATLAASGISTTGFTCYATNASGTVSATITIAYLAYLA